MYLIVGKVVRKTWIKVVHKNISQGLHINVIILRKFGIDLILKQKKILKKVDFKT